MCDCCNETGHSHKHVLYVGMGNRIKSDDGVGIYIAERLQQAGLENIIIAENSIENYIGKINSRNADQIIIIDAVDMHESPGTYDLIPVEHIVNTTSNTHNLSLDTIASFLDAKEISVLALQPEKVTFGTELTDLLKETADRLVVDLLKKAPITKNTIES